MATKSKIIVLSGVSRGLGFAMAGEFIRLGHTVAGCARSKSGVEELRKRFGAPHSWESVDVRSAREVTDWAETVLQAYGPPDLLINNAALINRNAPLWDITPQEFSDVVDVNLKGVHHLIHAFVPSMVKGRGGVIVNFSSGWGRSTSPEVAPYCATKWGIEGLTQALAQELPPGMAAVPLNPGVINTEMLRSCFGAGAESYPKPEAWAERAVPFMLSLGSRQNGQSLTVPGIPQD